MNFLYGLIHNLNFNFSFKIIALNLYKFFNIDFFGESSETESAQSEESTNFTHPEITNSTEENTNSTEENTNSESSDKTPESNNNSPTTPSPDPNKGDDEENKQNSSGSEKDPKEDSESSGSAQSEGFSRDKNSSWSSEAMQDSTSNSSSSSNYFTPVSPPLENKSDATHQPVADESYFNYKPSKADFSHDPQKSVEKFGTENWQDPFYYRDVKLDKIMTKEDNQLFRNKFLDEKSYWDHKILNGREDDLEKAIQGGDFDEIKRCKILYEWNLNQVRNDRLSSAHLPEAGPEQFFKEPQPNDARINFVDPEILKKADAKLEEIQNSTASQETEAKQGTEVDIKESSSAPSENTHSEETSIHSNQEKNINKKEESSNDSATASPATAPTQPEQDSDSQSQTQSQPQQENKKSMLEYIAEWLFDSGNDGD